MADSLLGPSRANLACDFRTKTTNRLDIYLFVAQDILVASKLVRRAIVWSEARDAARIAIAMKPILRMKFVIVQFLRRDEIKKITKNSHTGAGQGQDRDGQGARET